ncbi:DUF5694 domain-containing protein [Marinicella sp. W31]|uniref:DUF5694 domain-containing protein n=1 Tax=Marinicella sp. W31 TaxID=3023713 RepID=UPI003757814C
MRIIIFIVSVFLIFSGVTQQAKADEPKVLMLGSFHFNNPGLDVVKTEQINVMDAAGQAYLIQLSEQINNFKPTVVMLEFDPAEHKEMNQEYQQYLAGDFELPVNEMYQIGFRVARLAGLKQVHSFDEREVHWQGQQLMEYMSEHDADAMQSIQKKVSEITERMNADHKRLNLQQLLVQSNQQDYDHENMDFYLLTNPVGVDQGFAGADSTASWWHRNFRMYARIQQQAKKDARIFVVGGQGHTAILRNLMNIDSRIQQEPIVPYLRLKK